MPIRIATVLLVLFGMTAVAFAIIRRDDVDDSAYLVEASEFPAVVDLLEPGDCLATLIAPRWAITAAHCVEALTLPRTLEFGLQNVEVLGVVCHPEYDGESDDIALVHLSEAVDGVAPVSLYRSNDELGMQVVLVGRGDTGTGIDGQAGASLDLLTRRATNTVAQVETQWIRFVFHGPSDVEATALEGISGDGDSGGPAFIETPEGLQIAGLSAFQDADDDQLGRYGVTEFYTRVSSYQAFVDTTVGPGWDGQYRVCDTCSVRGAGVGVGSPWWLLACVLGIGSWRRMFRRRESRYRSRHEPTSRPAI